MVVKLRMKRFGRLNLPTYRVVAADSRSPRDGRIIEALGYYLPLMPREQEQLKLNAERISYWLSVGAQPSETVTSMLKRTGIALPTRKKRERKKSKEEDLLRRQGQILAVALQSQFDAAVGHSSTSANAFCGTNAAAFPASAAPALGLWLEHVCVRTPPLCCTIQGSGVHARPYRPCRSQD